MKPLPGKPAQPTDYIVHRRAEILRATPGFCGEDLSLLDLGCGNGATMVELAKDFTRVDGIDKARQPASILPGQSVWWVDLDTMAWFYSKHLPAADRIVCLEVLEHIAAPLVICKMIRDTLPYGGMAAVSVPNKWWVFETHGAWLPLLPWNRVPFFSWLPKRLHDRWAKARIYAKREIVNLLRQAGLSVLRVHYVRAPLDRLKWRWLAERLRGRKHTTRVPFFATSILVIAMKLQHDEEPGLVQPPKWDEVDTSPALQP